MILPSTQALSGPYAPTSDQTWLTIGTCVNGVVNFNFTANTGTPRTAHINLLGEQITITQAAATSEAAPTISSVVVNGDLLNVTSSILAAVENAGSTTVQITTSSADGFYVGELVQINNVGTAAFNGTYTVASVIDATDFTYTDANFDASSPGSISNGGSAVNALGGVQRSMVDSLTYQFDQAVNFGAGAITMDANSGYTGTAGALPSNVNYSTIDDGHTWLVTFSGATSREIQLPTACTTSRSTPPT